LVPLGCWQIDFKGGRSQISHLRQAFLHYRVLRVAILWGWWRNQGSIGEQGNPVGMPHPIQCHIGPPLAVGIKINRA
jgi:hypothetical protein